MGVGYRFSEDSQLLVPAAAVSIISIEITVP